jgi:ketosteroid isomerase-like protein
MRVESVDYDVNWKGFKRGTSIFIPCLNPKEALKEVRSTTNPLRYKLVTKVVIAEGIRGLRIWRM